jgi:hypothetical protein
MTTTTFETIAIDCLAVEDNPLHRTRCWSSHTRRPPPLQSAHGRQRDFDSLNVALLVHHDGLTTQ